MTTQLRNGYEAVKVPEGISRVSISDDYEGPNALTYMIDSHWYYSPMPSTGYILLGRADELTEEQCENVAGESEYCWACGVSHFPDYDCEGYNIYTTAKASFRSLLASLHLEPHTTIILKKENV